MYQEKLISHVLNGGNWLTGRSWKLSEGMGEYGQLICLAYYKPMFISNIAYQAYGHIISILWTHAHHYCSSTDLCGLKGLAGRSRLTMASVANLFDWPER